MPVDNIYIKTFIKIFNSQGMYVKVTKSGPRQYVQLVEAFRAKQRTVATLGRLDKLGDDLESVVQGLCKITGHTCLKPLNRLAR